MIKKIVVCDTNSQQYPDATYDYNNETIPQLGDSIMVYEIVKKGKVETKANPVAHVIRNIVYDYANEQIIIQTRG